MRSTIQCLTDGAETGGLDLSLKHDLRTTPLKLMSSGHGQHAFILYLGFYALPHKVVWLLETPFGNLLFPALDGLGCRALLHFIYYFFCKTMDGYILSEYYERKV